MQHNVLLIGRQFREDTILQTYILRHIKQAIHTVHTIYFLDEYDNTLFLFLEKEVEKEGKLIVITSKQTFSSVGKLLCTLTQDSQIVKEDMLLPSKTEIYGKNSYLLEHKALKVNVMMAQAGQTLPNVLFDEEPSTVVIHLFELSMEDISILVAPLAQNYEVNYTTFEVVYGWVELHIQTKRFGEISKFIVAVRALFNNKIIVSNNVLAHIVEKLNQSDKKITLAESCTGGLIATLFTKISGSSNVFEGSIVSYSNRLKEEWLGVDKEILLEHGAVSEATVKAMSKGAREVASADFALSVSGIAGPTGAVEGKEVGTVFLSVSTKKHQKTIRLQLQGDREYIQQQSAFYAIKALLLSDAALFFTNS